MVNVTVITFALIMKQRKPCQVVALVNGPSDGPGFCFVCIRAEVTTQGLPLGDQPQPL